MEIRLENITIDHDVQIREATNSALINEYSEAFDLLPPVIVFQDSDGVNWLADGFHRYQAAVQSKKIRIKCEIRKGSKRDAILFACGANRSHGLRRTNEDKWRAVQRLLADSEWSNWSDRKIAEQAGVAHTFVASIRGQVESDSTSKSKKSEKSKDSLQIEKRLGSDGKSYPAKKDDQKKKPDKPAPKPPKAGSEVVSPAKILDAMYKAHFPPLCRGIEKAAEAIGSYGPNYKQADDGLNMFSKAVKQMREGKP